MSEFSLPLSEKGRDLLASLLSHDDDVIGDLVGDLELLEAANEIRPLLKGDPDPEEVAANQRTINAAKEALEGWRGVKESGDETDLQDCITDLLHLAEAWHNHQPTFDDAVYVETSAWNNFAAETENFNYDRVNI